MNEVAPMAPIVAVLPAQILFDAAPTVIVGIEFTVNDNVWVLIHPDTFVPVTVYIVVDVGVTTILAPDKLPGFHVYVEAPVPANVAEDPAQTAVGFELAVNVGNEFTVKEIVFVFVHPAEVPVTVYTVVAVGETTVVVPDNAPGFHVYDVAPLPVNVADCPAQIAVGFDIAVTVGFGFTTKFTVLVAVQPKVVVPTTV